MNTLEKLCNFLLNEEIESLIWYHNQIVSEENMIYRMNEFNRELRSIEPMDLAIMIEFGKFSSADTYWKIDELGDIQTYDRQSVKLAISIRDIAKYAMENDSDFQSDAIRKILDDGNVYNRFLQYLKGIEIDKLIDFHNLASDEFQIYKLNEETFNSVMKIFSPSELSVLIYEGSFCPCDSYFYLDCFCENLHSCSSENLIPQAICIKDIVDYAITNNCDFGDSEARKYIDKIKKEEGGKE